MKLLILTGVLLLFISELACASSAAVDVKTFDAKRLSTTAGSATTASRPSNTSSDQPAYQLLMGHAGNSTSPKSKEFLRSFITYVMEQQPNLLAEFLKTQTEVFGDLIFDTLFANDLSTLKIITQSSEFSSWIEKEGTHSFHATGKGRFVVRPATPLILAARLGNAAMVKALLAVGSNPNTTLDYGREPMTALYEAILFQNPALQIFDRPVETSIVRGPRQYLDVVRLLLQDERLDFKAQKEKAFKLAKQLPKSGVKDAILKLLQQHDKNAPVKRTIPGGPAH